MTRLPALLLLLACSGERAERPSGIADSATPLRAAIIPKVRADTVAFADSVKRGDTTFHTKGRVITTVVVLTDSHWVVRPLVQLGIPFGAAALALDSACARWLGFNATILQVRDSASILADLAKAERCGARVGVRIRRAALKDAADKLCVACAHQEIARWPDLTRYAGNGTILFFHVGDDVERTAEWGYPLPTILAMSDTIARPLALRYPKTPRSLRAKATQMLQRPAEGLPDSLKWRWVTTAIPQFYAVARQDRPDTFFTREARAARRLKLGMATALNMPNGGCGPVARRHPDALRYACPTIDRILVAGDSIPGEDEGRYQLSALELTVYGGAAIREPLACAFVPWSAEPKFAGTFFLRPAIRDALKALSLVAKARPSTNCIQR